MQSLGGLQQVHALSFFGCDFDAGALGSVSPLKSVESVDLSSTMFGDEHTPLLVKAFPRLRRLKAERTPLTNSGLPALASLADLEQIDIGYTQADGLGFRLFPPDAPLRIVGLSRTVVGGSTTIDFNRCPIQDQIPQSEVSWGRTADLGGLARLQCLEVLDLSGIEVDPQQLSFMVSAKHLRWLALSNTTFDDSCCPTLAQVVGLEELGLADTEVTDNGLAVLLTGLKQLRCLDLRGTKVSMRGLNMISQSPTIRELYVSADKLRRSSDELRQELAASTVSIVRVGDDTRDCIKLDREDFLLPASAPRLLILSEFSVLPDRHPFGYWP